MKKTVWVLIIVLLVLAIIVGCAALYFLNSPYYALMGIMKDVKAEGMNGLESHLTGNAEAMMEKVTSVTENPMLTTILALFVQGDYQKYLDILQNELDNITWKVEDVMTGRKHAMVMLSFDYQGDVTGTINVSMLRTDDGWKIDGVNSPKIDGLSFGDIQLPDFSNFRFGGESEQSGSDNTESGGFRFEDIQLPDFENFNFEDIDLQGLLRKGLDAAA